MPANTVSVARPHRWGNPFRIVRGTDGRIEIRDAYGNVRSHALTMPEARRTAVALYRESITPEIAAQARAQLGGRHLACFCPPSDACHVDVLLEVANAGGLARQHQRYLEAGGEIPGDCWRTAIACLVEVPRDDVPHFIHEYAGDDEMSTEWWTQSVAFVEAAVPGWTLVCLAPEFPIYQHPDDAPRRVIVTGQSPRGDWLHCVIADAATGELVHDPYPGAAGVLTHVEVAALTQKDQTK